MRARLFGLPQLKYLKALDGGDDNTASCGTGPRNPDNLFDTSCNRSNGSALVVGTWLTEKDSAPPIGNQCRERYHLYRASPLHSQLYPSGSAL